jgi:uncharacterized protein YycO
VSFKAQFVRQAGPTSDIIALAGGGDQFEGFSHVDILLPNGNLLGARDDSVGGQLSGVWIRRPNYVTWIRRVVIEIPCSDAQAATAYAFANAQVGKPYDTTAILAFIAGRNWREPDSWFCSELFMASVETAGICDQLYSPVNKIMPTPAALVATALGGVVIEHEENGI